jgi:AcrR family transcriptional regulator
MSAARRRPRAYRQDLRAQQTGANADRIAAAAAGLIARVRRVGDITLEDIARESRLTVRTVLRRFGSRDGALEAAFARLEEEFRGMRPPTRPGDVDAAVAALVDQYERMGDVNIRALEAEDQLLLLHRALERGRLFHREWLSAVFAPQLSGLTSDERDRRLTALYAASDIYLWKLLRRDLSLDRQNTEDTIHRLVRGVLAAAAGDHRPRGATRVSNPD